MKLSALLTLAVAVLCLNSCSFFRKNADKTVTEAPAPQVTATVKTPAKPTAEQQAAAHAALAEQAAEEAVLFNTPAAAEESSPAPAEISTGGLRLRRFAPPEEAVSSAEGNDIPLPNSAELHGLRSPMLRGGALPMDINGKINPTDSQE